MQINVKLKEFDVNQKCLDEFFNVKLPARESLRLIGITNAFKTYKEHIQKVYEANGTPVNGMIQIKMEDMENFRKELNELSEETISFEYKKFNINELITTMESKNKEFDISVENLLNLTTFFNNLNLMIEEKSEKKEEIKDAEVVQ